MNKRDRYKPDIDAECIMLEAHLDQLLDRDLRLFDRLHAECVSRMGFKLLKASAYLRRTLERQAGTLGGEMERLP